MSITVPIAFYGAQILSTYCILSCTQEYKMHSGVVSSEQSPCWEKPSVIPSVNWQIIKMCLCTGGRLAVSYSDLHWCSMVSHELEYHHKKSCMCNNYRARQLREILQSWSTHNCDDNSYMGWTWKWNLTLSICSNTVKFKGSLLKKSLPYKTAVLGTPFLKDLLKSNWSWIR